MEYLGDWDKVINIDLLIKTLNSKELLSPFYPNKEDVFKAFKLCSLDNCKVVILGMDPYPQEGVATGVMFGNKEGTKDISPSLKVLKSAAIDPFITHNYPIEFDITLEDWCKQGVLMLNSSLTVAPNSPGSHSMIWRPFIKDFLYRLSNYDYSIPYILMGSQAKSFDTSIRKESFIIKTNHPSYYARTGEEMDPVVFYKINKYICEMNKEPIQWYR